MHVRNCYLGAGDEVAEGRLGSGGIKGGMSYERGRIRKGLDSRWVEEVRGGKGRRNGLS